MPSQNIQVCVRFRPLNAREKRELAPYSFDFEFQNNNQTISISSSNVLISQNSYNFDYCFDENTTQDHFYEITGKPVVDDVFKGYNGTIFAYGQTGAGKSFSMMGDLSSEENKGLIPRASESIFKKIENGGSNESSSGVHGTSSNIEYRISCSYLEIYNEMIQDLLDTNKKNLKVHESPSRGIYVEDLTEHVVSSAEEIYAYLDLGAQNRVVSATNMNAVSSRSHSVFIIRVTQTNTATGSVTSGALNLVDLAGSEKVGKTGATGQTLEEAKKINQSLSALGQCINALVEGKPHIPFRNSKLTRILQQSLGGNSKTTMICACSPSAFNAEETISTIKFGQRAKTIKCKVKLNQFRSAKELELLIEKLNSQIKKLRLSNKKYREMLSEFRKKSGLPELISDDDETYASSTIRDLEVKADINNEDKVPTSENDAASDDSNNPTLKADDEKDISLSMAELQLRYDDLNAKYIDDTEQLAEELEIILEENLNLEKQIKELEKICEENEISLEELLEELDVLTKEKELLEKKLSFQKEEADIELEELLVTVENLEKEKSELEEKLKELSSSTSNQEEIKDVESSQSVVIIEDTVERAKVVAELHQLRELTRHQQEVIDRHGDSLSIAHGAHEETKIQLIRVDEELQYTKKKALKEKEKLSSQLQTLRREKYDVEKRSKIFEDDLTEAEANAKKFEKSLSIESRKSSRYQKEIVSLQSELRKQNSLILDLRSRTQVNLGNAEEDMLEIYKQQLSELQEVSERMNRNQTVAINELQEEVSELTKKLHISQRKGMYSNMKNSSTDSSIEIVLQEELGIAQSKMKELEEMCTKEQKEKEIISTLLAVEKRKVETHKEVMGSQKRNYEILVAQLRSENEGLIVDREQLKQQIVILGGSSTEGSLSTYKGSFGRMINELFELRTSFRKCEYERNKLLEENNHQRKVISSERLKSQNYQKRLNLQVQRTQLLESELQDQLAKVTKSTSLHDKFRKKEELYLEQIKKLEDALASAQETASRPRKPSNVYKPVLKS